MSVNTQCSCKATFNELKIKLNKYCTSTASFVSHSCVARCEICGNCHAFYCFCLVCVGMEDGSKNCAALVHRPLMLCVAAVFLRF